MELQINDKTYTLRLGIGECEAQWHNEETGLEKVAVMEQVQIGAAHSKSIQTRIFIYDITPTGQRINRREVKHPTSEDEFDFFEQSQLGGAIKLFILNGIVRKMGIAHAIFNDAGEVEVKPIGWQLEPVEEGGGE